MNETLNLTTLTFAVILIYTGVSIALFVAYKVLNKYSNFGDSSCDINEYSRRGIRYEHCRDEVTSNMNNALFADYGVDTYGNRKHTIPEQLLKNAKKDPDEEQFDMDMEKYL